MDGYANAKTERQAIVDTIHRQLDELDSVVNRLAEMSNALCGARLSDVSDKAPSPSGALNSISNRLSLLNRNLLHVSETLGQAIN